jgi:hypothetical protein
LCARRRWYDDPSNVNVASRVVVAPPPSLRNLSVVPYERT